MNGGGGGHENDNGRCSCPSEEGEDEEDEEDQATTLAIWLLQHFLKQQKLKPKQLETIAIHVVVVVVMDVSTQFQQQQKGENGNGDHNLGTNNNNVSYQNELQNKPKRAADSWCNILRSKGFRRTTTNDENIVGNNDKVYDVVVALCPTTTTAVAATTSSPTDMRHEQDRNSNWTIQELEPLVAPGGLLVLRHSDWDGPSDSSSRRKNGKHDGAASSSIWDSSIWQSHNVTNIPQQQQQQQQQRQQHPPHGGRIILTICPKWVCPIQDQACPWLGYNNNNNKLLLDKERQRLDQASVYTTVQEQETHRLSNASMDRAVHCLKTTGYCILPRLLDSATSQAFGRAALSDLDQAVQLLWQHESVDLWHPGKSQTLEPASYQELSMREDLRVDLRHGPALQQIRGAAAGSKPWTITAQTPLIEVGAAATTDDNSNNNNHCFLRGHVDLVDIVRRVMNPRQEQELQNDSNSNSSNAIPLYQGNFGRWNFGGHGPDGSFVDLRVGPVGAIVSLPGSADQAVHADTPHLWEHVDDQPAHYINAFTPAISPHPLVGQTALVHASHRLLFCAQHANSSSSSSSSSSVSTPNIMDAQEDHDQPPPSTSADGWKSFVVRPYLNLGDVLLFDCRILHFGMANASSDIRRPLLYTNMTQHWFHDPKNWDNERSIFDKNNRTKS
ncbi:hypothetical protein ACA910_009019 [Epithemia clementina (nom. ined.)]